MYYMKHVDQLIIMLGGSEKSRQAEDIKAAQKLAARIREANDDG